jgi:SAM-dependent methyltransferase
MSTFTRNGLSDPDPTAPPSREDASAGPRALTPTHETLARYYLDRGLSEDQFCLGEEHPGLENLALALLRESDSRRVLEIGYQSGGFAVPLILELNETVGFRYVGLDNFAYPNAVETDVVRDFLAEANTDRRQNFEFRQISAGRFLMHCREQFDLILIDHVKKLYPRTLLLIFARRLVAPEGVILLHDVLGCAAGPWRRCIAICSTFGYCWEIVDDVPGGVAIIRPGDLPWREKLLARPCELAIRASYPTRSRLHRCARSWGRFGRD